MSSLSTCCRGYLVGDVHDGGEVAELVVVVLERVDAGQEKNVDEGVEAEVVVVVRVGAGLVGSVAQCGAGRPGVGAGGDSRVCLAQGTANVAGSERDGPGRVVVVAVVPADRGGGEDLVVAGVAASQASRAG
jgi:hypothetical protein